MGIRQLRALVAIADTGSFHDAAERLFVTQSAVSMQMKALESGFGVELFDRSRRPPVLNGLGRAMVLEARRIVADYDRLAELATASESELVGRLRLGAIPSATAELLPEALSAMRNQHPRLAIKVETGLSNDLQRQIVAGTLDIAIVTEVGGGGDLVSRTVLSEPLFAIAHRRFGATNLLGLLEDQPFIRFNRRSGVGRIIETGLERFGIRVEEVMELDSLATMVLMVSSGLGASVVPQRSIPAAARSELTVLPFGDPPLRRSVVLIARRGDSHARAYDELYRRLRDAAAEAP